MNPQAPSFSPKTKKNPSKLKKRRRTRKKTPRLVSKFADLRAKCGCEQVRDQLEEMKILLWQGQKQVEQLETKKMCLRVELIDWKNNYNALPMQFEEYKAKHADSLNAVCFVHNFLLTAKNQHDNCSDSCIEY